MSGGMCLGHDVDKTAQWRASDLLVAPQMMNDMNPRSHMFALTVRRGTILPDIGGWENSPVFRIPHELYSPRELQRVMTYFILNSDYQPTKNIFYEPDIADIVDPRYSEFEDQETVKTIAPMPLWALNIFDQRGEFEAALQRGLIGALPDEMGKKQLTEGQYKAIKKGLEDRRAKEVELIQANKIDLRKLGLVKAIVEEIKGEEAQFKMKYADIKTWQQEEAVEPLVDISPEMLESMYGIKPTAKPKQVVTKV